MESIIGNRYKNISGRTIQVPNRISEEFSWSPEERIEIKEELNLFGEDGYIVHNLDYVGVYTVHETAWITKYILLESFRLISTNDNT